VKGKKGCNGRKGFIDSLDQSFTINNFSLLAPGRRWATGRGGGKKREGGNGREEGKQVRCCFPYLTNSPLFTILCASSSTRGKKKGKRKKKGRGGERRKKVVCPSPACRSLPICLLWRRGPSTGTRTCRKGGRRKGEKKERLGRGRVPPTRAFTLPPSIIFISLYNIRTRGKGREGKEKGKGRKKGRRCDHVRRPCTPLSISSSVARGEKKGGRGQSWHG